MTDFASATRDFIAELFRLDPLRATGAGNHDYDGKWPDFSPAGLSARMAFADGWTGRLSAFADADLSVDERVDRDLLLMELDAARFYETVLRQETWDPLTWIYILGDGIFSLLARDFAPLADRLTSVASRLEGVPAVLDWARHDLVGGAGRPVQRLHTETALRQLDGIEDLIGDARSQAEAAVAAGNVAVSAVEARLARAAAGARAALAGFETHLRDVVLPASDGEGRLGAELFATRLRHTLKSDMSPAEVRDRAQREFDAVRAEMIRLAGDLWPTWMPGVPPPTGVTADERAAADRDLVRGVLDAIGRVHPAADDILQFCRDEVKELEAFVRSRDLMGLSDEPLEIRWTPTFLRAFGGAMLHSPGPLDKGQKAFFSVTPIPDDWTPEQAESYLREDNDRMLRLLTIHEAVPGHYLQGVYANRHWSLPRAVFWSGVFAEGWAVYVTEVMMDAGYRADDPALMLVHWKFYIRAVINALIDVGIHTADMTEAEALELMIDGGFQEDAEARNKWNRARLTSTQLSTYFVGSVLFWDLERDARRAAAVASGDPRGAAAVPEARVVGAFGETPGFDYRAHLEGVISHGSPPMSLLRRLVLGEGAG